jgi:hypothetical protein
MAWACPSAIGACLLPCAAAGGFPGRLLQRVAFRDEKKAPEMRSGGRVCWSLDGMRAARCLHPGEATRWVRVSFRVGVALFDARLRVSPVLCNRFCIVSVWAEVSSCFLAAHMTRLRQARYGNKHDPPSPAPLAGFCLCAPRRNADHRNQCASTSFERWACWSCSEGVGHHHLHLLWAC